MKTIIFLVAVALLSVCHTTDVIRSLAFKKLGSYSYPSEQVPDRVHIKSYFYAMQFRGSWIDSTVICKSMGMELITFQSHDEQVSFKSNYAVQLRALGAGGFYVGGLTQTAGSPTEWYWTDSNPITQNKKIGFPIDWFYNEPSNTDGNEYCLNIYTNDWADFLYNDISCNERVALSTFICQEVLTNVEVTL